MKFENLTQAQFEELRLNLNQQQEKDAGSELSLILHKYLPEKTMNAYSVVVEGRILVVRASCLESAAHYLKEQGVSADSISACYKNISMSLEPSPSKPLRSAPSAAGIPEHVRSVYGFTGEPIRANPREVVVYVLDTGVAMLNDQTVLHETLRPCVKTLATIYGKDDCHGHGTHVCSTIAQMARDAQIISVKVLGDDGFAPFDVILNCYRQCVQDKIANYPNALGIVNMSLGGEVANGDSMKLLFNREFSNALTFHNMLTFVAAGNGARPIVDASSDVIPAACSAAYAILAATRDQRLAFFSNFGMPSQYLTAAIGRNVLAADHKSTDGMVYMDGTSMATPVVAGLAASLGASGLKSKEIIEKIKASAPCELSRVETDPRINSCTRFLGRVVEEPMQSARETT